MLPSRACLFLHDIHNPLSLVYVAIHLIGWSSLCLHLPGLIESGGHAFIHPRTGESSSAGFHQLFQEASVLPAGIPFLLNYSVGLVGREARVWQCCGGCPQCKLQLMPRVSFSWQLFIGTLLFTVLVFLLPTTALYYLVFTLVSYGGLWA